ncbi:PAH-inducible cytochrome P450 monooxygenase [Mycena sanguinolenta]|uniref:PAH-inducible cytochrome P450 monooxygenase n=1 Tax=Mycena sanguinolenta TaxID=230812 RepID=A0A8H6WWV8_9AGAR|nr:PAH-inducible cytochrome P450 monooxygenase [Mycena sanguinolenta]
MEGLSLSSGSLVTALGLATVLVFVASKFRSSVVGKLPGPPAPSWIYGNLMQLIFPSIYGEFEFEWQKKYGTVYRIKGLFGEDLLMVSDPVGMQAIMNSHSFIRAPIQFQKGKLIFGERSVYCAEGNAHRRLRAALNPGFTPAVVKNFRPIFSEVAQRIVQGWEQFCSAGSPARINVCDLLDHATLDVISEAALGVPVNTVADPKHPLAQTHLHVLSSGLNRSKADIFTEALLPYIPTFILLGALRLPTAAFRAVRSFRSVTDAMSTDIIRSKTEEETLGNDVLSILIKGLSGQRKEKLTPSELAEQVRLILLGGQDTSADTLAWCLHELAKDPDYQEKLRAEIQLHRSRSDEIDYDSMPLLNALIKETLRFYPPAPYLERAASEDLVIPLGSEVTTASGERISQLPVKKGQFIAVAIAAFQREESLWGPDADKFKPSRWIEGDPYKGKALGPYAQLMAFSGGYRVCVGWRFALLEMQIILAELVLNFSFASSKDDPVRPLYAGILLPMTEKDVKGLPLFIERVSQ